ncbi:ribosomal protein s10p/S20e domain-containing protein [Ditylenchus destructor]|uniref:Ribosomal protein s10p/S20e domain-containing protein n=1 Tax=Ditylenchus destructor TaxID=166010 RepID=A0AAD4N380_9BILA|nr:ribosomal protein s10p/S20e domain-containing protein [Ditylenchus destructor]
MLFTNRLLLHTSSCSYAFVRAPFSIKPVTKSDKMLNFQERQRLINPTNPLYLIEPEPEPEPPAQEKFCDLMNIRLQSYDYVQLEKFQSFVHRTANRFGFKVEESYAVAPIKWKVKLYKTELRGGSNECDLTYYDRWLRLKNVSALEFPIFLMLIQAHTPISTKITIKPHEKEDREYRYIPDLKLKAKQAEYRSLDDPRIRKQLGWMAE